MKIRAWRFLLAIVVAAPLFSLDPTKTLTQEAHRIWDQEEGLFQPTVYSIVQTRDGFLWLGTQDSLIRFDGLHFREYGRAAEAGLQRGLIRSLFEDQAGNLWVGSIGSGLVRIAPNGNFKAFGGTDGLNTRNVFCVHPGQAGEVLVCSDKGLLRFHGDRLTGRYTQEQGLPANGIRDACRSEDGSIWVAGLDFGLAAGREGKFREFVTPEISQRENVSVLSCPASNVVWAATPNGLARIENGISKTFSAKDGLSDNAVSSLHQSPDGSLWIGASDGVTRYRNGQFTVFRVRDGLSHSQVLSLYTDREGSLWVGTKNGVDQFYDSKVTPYTANEGLAGNNAGAVAEDANGRLWIGTLGQGLNSFDGKQFNALTTRDGLLDGSILSLLPESDGGLWVGTARGLNHLRNGRVAASYTRANGLPGEAITALQRDPQGTLWAGTDQGLAYLEGSRFHASQAGLLAGHRAIYALSSGGPARLFASAEGPLLSYLVGRTAHSVEAQASQPVGCFYFDAKRGIGWLGTLGSGLLYWKNGSVTHVRIRDGLYDNRIYAILRDGRKNLWFASSKGIFRVAEAELLDFVEGKVRYVTSIPFSTGQLRFECRAGVQPAACRTRDGRLWFATSNGLVAVDPQKLNENTEPPPVQITTVVINGQRVEPRQDFALSPNERNVEIRFAGLSFIAPGRMTFRYMLEGYEKNWVDAGTRRETFYANLPPGHFRFLVMARNADGVWSKGSAGLRFSVTPRVYQRIWFFPLVILLCAVSAMAWYRLRIRRLQQGFSLVLGERSRIARELHDTLLQGLSGVTMQLQALWTRLSPSKEKEALHEIIQDAARCSREARQSLWGLRSSTPGSIPFSEKLAHSCREANAGGRMELDLRLEPVSLASMPDAEYQILRIAREAVANAVQHSQGTHLAITLKSASRGLDLSIQDNGRGFDRRQPHSGHFGLIGMRERAKEINAQMEILSEADKGVRIHLFLPLTTPGKANRAAQVEAQLQ